MPTRLRRALGAFALLLYLCVYVIGAVWLSGIILRGINPWLQLGYFAIAGIIWIVPLKPLFRWMK